MFKNKEVKQGSTSRNIGAAEKKLAEINMSKEERAVYERFLINSAREKDAINTAKEEGREKGRQERDIEIAKEMITDGETNAKIKKYTGLSDEQIDGLREGK